MTNKSIIKKSMILALVAATLGLFLAFGVSVTQAQQDAILSFTGVACSMIIATGVFGAHLQDDTTTEEENDANDPS